MYISGPTNLDYDSNFYSPYLVHGSLGTDYSGRYTAVCIIR